MNVEVFESEDKLRDAIRQTVRGQIQFNADVVVAEGVDMAYIKAYAKNMAKTFMMIGIVPSIAAAVAGLLVGGGAAIAAGAGVLGTSAIIGYFYGKKRAVTNPKVYNALFNAQVGDKFDRLVDVTEQRDAIFKEFARYKTVRERNTFQKRVGNKIETLSKEMKRVSSELRADVIEIGSDLEINEYDYENLMTFLEKGEKAAISDVLSDRSEVAKLEKVEGSEEDLAA